MMSYDSKKIYILLILCAICLSSPVLADDFRAGAGGMQIKDMQLGLGKVATVDMIATIHFTAWLDEQGSQGKMIYNSRDHGEPISFVIGTDRVMPAWNKGVLGMQPGGQRLLLVPPAMAYGNRAIQDDIPANTSLIFNFELLELRSK